MRTVWRVVRWTVGFWVILAWHFSSFFRGTVTCHIDSTRYAPSYCRRVRLPRRTLRGLPGRASYFYRLPWFAVRDQADVIPFHDHLVS